MFRRSQAIILLLCAALGTGCGSDSALGPGASGREQTRFSVRVTPDKPVLFVAGPVNVRQLGIAVFDERGQIMLGPFSIAYSSSAPGIVSVSKDGVVTGVAVGTATITTTVTFGRATQVATTSVTVAVNPLDHWRIAGTYDLTATVSMTIDPLGWDGDLPSAYEYTGVLTFPPGSDVGIFTDVPVLDEDGQTVLTAVDGPIALDVPPAWALFVLRLGPNWRAFVEDVEEAGEDGASSPLIKGRLMGTFMDSFGTLALSGPFVARLRGSTLSGE